MDALVLFNRFYQPDIDVEQLEVLRVQLVELVGTAVAAALAGDSVGENQGIAGGHGRRSYGHRRHQSRDGRRAWRANGLGTAGTRPRVISQTGARRDQPLDGGTRIRIAAADAGQHELVAVREPQGLRTRQLREDPPKLLRRRVKT